ncbi:MAG TPA: tyrosine--tRNA ligase [Candidatus Limnocylindria bacterium]|nr:tyrosine--tRNA ligase [Candidatus Limnocylindria bacterium]
MAADILDELDWRGAVAHSTDADALRAALAESAVTFYCGFDPTAPSLHFGNLVQLVTMRRLQLAGHDPIAVVGGATGLIGDPSGRSAERSLNEADVVADWVEKIRVQVERYLEFSGAHAARVVNNLDWTVSVSALDFLRDVGKHFSVNRMLDKESVKARLDGPGISFTEFSYQILQAFDYLELHRRYGCSLQTGGSDQWGNLTAGVDLIRRVTGASVHALATPLITKADGTKYGKTADGTLWLDPKLTSPYAFYQYFLNQDDADIGSLLRIFSFRSQPEIEVLEGETAQHPEARSAQQALASELTELVHGADATSQAAAASAALFGKGDLQELDAETLASALGELPHAEVRGAMPSIVDLMVAAGLADSRTAARRTVTDGGAYLNNERVADPEMLPGDGDLLHGRWLVLRRGKRSLAAIERVA